MQRQLFYFIYQGPGSLLDLLSWCTPAGQQMGYKRLAGGLMGV